MLCGFAIDRVNGHSINLWRVDVLLKRMWIDVHRGELVDDSRLSLCPVHGALAIKCYALGIPAITRGGGLNEAHGWICRCNTEGCLVLAIDRLRSDIENRLARHGHAADFVDCLS